MRKQLLPLLLGLGVLALVLAGCAATGQQPTHASSGEQTFMEVSWAEMYDDLPSLKKASDLAVVGVFTRATQNPPDKDGIVYTDFAFGVGQVLYNPKGLRIAGPLVIHQTGGVVNGVPVEVESDPLFRVGEQAVLFLRQFAPNNFFVVGGPGGRFEVKKGMVTPADANPIKFAPRALDAFLADIENA